MSMIPRHFVYFAQGGTARDGGAWLREAMGPVPSPNIAPDVVGDDRIRQMNAWATTVSAPQPGEVCLDVTDVDTGEDYQLGDFVWARFDEVGRRVVWTTHTFLEFDRGTMRLKGVWQSARPVYSTEDTVVIDVTGTALEPLRDRLLSDICVTPRGRRELADACAGLDPMPLRATAPETILAGLRSRQGKETTCLALGSY